MGKELVGFLMYDVPRGRRKAPRGYGRAALNEALKEIRAIHGVKKVLIQYMPANRVAKGFYASFGFVEIGRDRDGEVIAELTF